MASNLKMEYHVFHCIFKKNSSMAALCLKKMGKFLAEGREKSLLSWLSQFSILGVDTMPLSLKNLLLNISNFISIFLYYFRAFQRGNILL